MWLLSHFRGFVQLFLNLRYGTGGSVAGRIHGVFQHPFAARLVLEPQHRFAFMSRKAKPPKRAKTVPNTPSLNVKT